MSTRRKILMLTTQLGYGGAETSFIRLANFLAQSMEVTVALFTGDYGKGAYALGHEPLNATITLLDQPTARGRIARWRHRIARLRSLKQQHNATISFLSGPNLANVLAGSNARSIVSLRGSRHYDPVARIWQRRLFQHLLDPIIYRLAARIVPVSAGLTYEIWQAAGAPAVAKTQVISPFVDGPSLQQRLAEPAPTTYAALAGQPVIVAVGRLSVEKGFHHLIRVFAALVQKQADAKLLLVGDGPMMTALREQCNALGLSIDDATPCIASVLFTGYQKNPLPLMALGRVYAMTSATEGFPSVLLEAMAAGLPVVAADTPWGARAILSEDAVANQQLYPTQQATVTAYGTLMPRIDHVQHEAEWVRVLQQHLQHPRVANPAALARIQQYDLSAVGAQWLQLIEGMPQP